MLSRISPRIGRIVRRALMLLLVLATMGLPLYAPPELYEQREPAAERSTQELPVEQSRPSADAAASRRRQ